MNKDNIKSLIKILEESSIDEMEITTFWGKEKIRIKKSESYSDPVNTKLNHELIHLESPKKNNDENIESNEKVSTDTNTLPIEDKIIKQENYKLVKAPLVGTYYMSPKPGDPPFIKVGDFVKEGQIICIIEAMKIFNEIESEFSGKVDKILVDDGTPVEFDQELISILPE